MSAFERLDGGDPAAVDRAAAALQAGDVIVLPTDTVYGLAALPAQVKAMARIHALKDRPPEVPIAVLVASPAQAAEVGVLSLAAQRLAGRWWPGPLTLVVMRGRGFDPDLGGDPTTVGIRCPAHPFVRALASRVGPLATTSANRHGRPTPATAEAAAADLAGPVEVVVDGGPLDGAPSTVVDCTVEPVRVLRVGAVPRTAVIEAAGPHSVRPISDRPGGSDAVQEEDRRRS
jgi:L-threonylcarbamoyladenylate synthase